MICSGVIEIMEPTAWAFIEFTSRTSIRSRSSGAGELVLQGVEDAEDVRDVRAEAHEADAPDLPLEGADAAADLDVVLLEEAAPHRHLVDAIRDADGGEG